jgi:UMF1 family MFS transporter
MYDWANSVYATIMMAAIYPIFFTATVNHWAASVSGASRVAGDAIWGWGNSGSMLVVAVLAPIIGAAADYKGFKKKLFTVFFVIGLVFTLFAGYTGSWIVMILAYALSRVGYSSSCLVYDSFITDVTTPEKMDKVSNYGYAFGYIGGSTIPFIIAIVLMQFMDTSRAVQVSILMTVLWWGLFTIPFFKDIRHEHGVPAPENGAFAGVFRAIWATFKKILADKKVFYFMLAYFLYIDGVDTIITMSTAYGTTLGLGATGMVLALLVTQLVAFPCSMFFSKLTKRFGSLQMIVAAVFLYLLITVIGFIMGFGIEKKLFSIHTAQCIFWVVAVMVGMAQGGIQATSRSHLAKLIPAENSGEFFGFFDIFGKFASILGPFLYGLIKRLSGSSAYAILGITALFVAALVIFACGWKKMNLNLPRSAG